MTYVFTAPDFNKSAGSIGKSAGVGFSRMLEGMSKFMMMNWGWIDETISNAGGTPWSTLGQVLRRQCRCRIHLHIEEAVPSVL
jgi:hypothetical protein